MMKDMEKDINYLMETGKEAIRVLRRNAEYFEAQGKDSSAEREAVRWLNLAIQLVQYDFLETGGNLDKAMHLMDGNHSLDEERMNF